MVVVVVDGVVVGFDSDATDTDAADGVVIARWVLVVVVVVDPLVGGARMEVVVVVVMRGLFPMLLGRYRPKDFGTGSGAVVVVGTTTCGAAVVVVVLLFDATAAVVVVVESPVDSTNGL